MNCKQILSELTSLDTHTDMDMLEAVQWVEQYLQSYGIETKRIYNPAKTRASLYASIGSADGAIVFNGHLDTFPALGIDAVAFLVKVANLFYATLEEYKEVDNSFEVPTSTGIISKIQGGQAVNVVADTASLKCSVRFMTDKARNNFIDVYCQRLRLLEQTINGLNFDIKVGSGLPALNIISENLIDNIPFQRAKNTSHYTEAGRFCEHNIPAIVFGPGNIAQAHAENGFVEKNELENYMNDLLRITLINKSR